MMNETKIFLLGLFGGLVIGGLFALLQEIRARNLERAIDLLIERYEKDEKGESP